MRDAIVTPFRMMPAHLLDGGPYDRYFKFVTGSVYDSDRMLVPESLRVGGVGGDHVRHYAPERLNETYLQRHRAKPIPGKAVYFGHFYSHYGHFITEGVSRLHGIRNMRHYDYFIFYPFVFHNGRVFVRGFHKHVLKFFGIPYEKVLFIGTRFFRFERLDVYRQLWPINSAPDPDLLRSYTRIIRPYQNGPPRRWIFLSRDPKRNARTQNMLDLEEVFRRRGFEVIRAEKLSFEEQLGLYANAAMFAAPAGSGMHNALFLQHGASAIEIGDPRTPDDFAPMQAHANALSRANVSRIPYRGSKSGDIDIDFVAERLETLLDQARGS